MENNLISRQAAIDALKKAYWDKDIQSAKDDPCIVDAMTDWAIRQIKALPSAQPEIIRCKDCKYAEMADPEDNQDGYTCQFHRGSIWFSGSYCSWGERRTDG